MIEQIFKVLDMDKYSVLKYDEKISIGSISIDIFGKKYVDQETEIEVKKAGERTYIRFRNRNRYDYEFIADDEMEVLCYIIILCYKRYENGRFELQFTRELDNLLVNGNIEKAIEMVKEKIPDNLFSIFTQKENAVCLLNDNNEFVIKYYSKSFQKQVNQFPIKLDEITRAYGVLFNYSYKLKQFNDVYNKMVELNFIENDCEETYNYYLNIYL